MTPAQGQTLRRVGLLLEVLSMFGLFSLGKGRVDIWKDSGMDPSVVWTIGLVLGVLLWAVGTYYIHRERLWGSSGKPS
jgi:hypothetical protein